MHVVVTGGAGFLGSRLARDLLAAGSLRVAGGEDRPPDRLTLVDRAPLPPDLAADERVTAVRGDLAELMGHEAAARDTLNDAEVIFHLAAAVSAECEADFDLGLRANLQATQSLLASCRALGTSPVVVFSSSRSCKGGSRIAVPGADAGGGCYALLLLTIRSALSERPTAKSVPVGRAAAAANSRSSTASVTRLPSAPSRVIQRDWH